MERRTDEEGFLLLETALLGFLLLAMAGMFLLTRHAAELHHMEACRTAALSLATEELVELELCVKSGASAEASYGWLGPERDRSLRQTDYEVTGTIHRETLRVYALAARVTWQERGQEKELRLEKRVAKHDVP